MLKDALLKFLKLEGLINNLTRYIETRMELFKLEVKEELAKSMAKLLVMLLLAFAFTFFLLFISVAAAYFLGESVGIFNGFLIIAVFYLVVALSLFLSRKSIIEKMERKLLDVFKQKEK